MTLASGTRLGVYEILAPIGKGGMGEVYRARDTKLDRDVAIKVLPEELASDEERVARFDREAKLLASLNHPNIASIYGFEESSLVLELVEGPTLAERIGQGAIPVDEVTAIAKQIAEALEAGHEAGVIHRDLKPANIKVKEDGTVKVLDYGLAKALASEVEDEANAELSQPPTLTRQGTQAGVILGTAAYMSPEQAKGKLVDKRADIWAFGAVFYEMLTGRRAFDGNDFSEILASVIKTEPEWDLLPGDLPSTLRAYLKRCLEKDPRKRVRDIGDLRLALDGAFDGDAHAEAAGPGGRGMSRGIAATAALFLSVVTGVVVWTWLPSEEASRAITRFSVALPQTAANFTIPRAQLDVIVSIASNGSKFAYTADNQLYLRSMDQPFPTVLEGTEGARSPFLSPDGEWVGFVADGQLKKVPSKGGPVVSLCEERGVRGIHWGADGNIIFGHAEKGILRVSSDGGTPEVLVPPRGHTLGAMRRPQLLPDGDTLLLSFADTLTWDDAQVVALSLDTGEETLIIERARDARYVRSGHLVYLSGTNLLAAPFDPDTLELTGPRVPIAEGVMTTVMSGAAMFDVSDNGALVYFTGLGMSERTLVWVDPTGKKQPINAPPRAYVRPRISPDGSRVAVDVYEEDRDIWIWNFERETMHRLTFAPGQDVNPVWTPDGARIAFSSERSGPMNLFWKSADGSGSAEPLNAGDDADYMVAFTPDGTSIVFNRFDSDFDVYLAPTSGAAAPLVASEFREISGEISPDGRYIAYESQATGQLEVYVRTFPNVDEGQWLISTGGGTAPVWAPSENELFYVGPGGSIMAVGIDTEPGFEAGRPRELFRGYYHGSPGRTYDVAPDGKRFLMLDNARAEDNQRGLFVVQNWDEALRAPEE